MELASVSVPLSQRSQGNTYPQEAAS
jgi:hypothetical protein